MLLDVGLVLVGLVGLFVGGEWLVKGSSRVALRLGISPLIIGLTVVAFGTSMPELLVSVSAALRGVSGIAVGNVVGSNIANIGLILGVAGIITPIAVQAILVRREIPIMIGVSIFAYLLVLDGMLSRLDGILLLFAFLAFNGLFYMLAKKEAQNHHDDIIDTAAAHIHLGRELLRVTAGILLLFIGAQALVQGATSIAQVLGVSDLVIGVTIVAFGTSLPELATSIVGAMRGENDIVVGNIIGSNIANLLLILGATAFILPIPIDAGLTQFEFVVMLLFSFMLLPFGLNKIISRRESAVFLGAYAAFIIYVFAQSVRTV